MGFEPMNHFWRLHALQACALDHSAISPFIPRAQLSKECAKVIKNKIKYFRI